MMILFLLSTIGPKRRRLGAASLLILCLLVLVVSATHYVSLGRWSLDSDHLVPRMILPHHKHHIAESRSTTEESRGKRWSLLSRISRQIVSRTRRTMHRRHDADENHHPSVAKSSTFAENSASYASILWKGGHQSSRPSSQRKRWFLGSSLFRRFHFRRSATAPTINEIQIFHAEESDQVTSNNNIDQEHRILSSLTEPIIAQDVWDHLTGHEFPEHPDRLLLLDRLAATGERLARNDLSDDWIQWRPYGAHDDLEDGHIHVWTGQAKREGRGSNVPWIKTRSILPMTPEEMKDLLLDSDRVKTYNPWSLGRKDYWKLDENTKIVKNRTQPPIGSKPMVSVTLLHARPLQEANAWIVVSRAIGGKLFLDSDDQGSGRSDILFGINLLQPYDDDSCLVTAVTHVDSSAVPSMLAEKLGVKGAIKFVKDIRKLKVPVSAN